MTLSKISAYEIFKRRLLAGELLPGQFVSQRELAEHAGVPLGAAREAIQKLQHETLMKVHPQRGIQVTEVTNRMIHDTFGLRLILERDAVKAFALQPDKTVVQKLLDEVVSALDAVRVDMSSRSLDNALEVDWRMHDTIIESLNNQLVSEIYQINAVRLRLIKANNRLNPDRVFGALEEHVDILTHCRDGDPDGAARAMESHIKTALGRALQGI